MLFNKILLRLLLIEHDLTEKKLASISGVSIQTISNWLHDREMPDIFNLKKVAGVFNRHETDFILKEMNKKTKKYLLKKYRARILEEAKNG